MTTIFEGRPPPKQGLFKSEQGSFGFQVYKYIYNIYIYALIFQFPIYIWNYLEPSSQLPIYQVTIDPWFQIYRELEDEGIMCFFKICLDMVLVFTIYIYIYIYTVSSPKWW